MRCNTRQATGFTPFQVQSNGSVTVANRPPHGLPELEYLISKCRDLGTNIEERGVGELFGVKLGDSAYRTYSARELVNIAVQSIITIVVIDGYRSVVRYPRDKDEVEMIIRFCSEDLNSDGDGPYKLRFPLMPEPVDFTRAELMQLITS